MKVAIIEPFIVDRSGHYFNFITDLYNGFVKIGCESEVYVPENCEIDEYKEKLIPSMITSLEGMGVLRKAFFHFQYIYKFRKFFCAFSKRDFDLLFISSANYWGIVFAVALCRLKKPVFLYLHNINIFTSRNIILKYFLKFFYMRNKDYVRFFTPGHVDEDEFKSKVVDIDKILFSDVPYVQRAPQFLLKNTYEENSDFMVSYLGDPRREKGFFEVARLMSVSYADIKFMLQVYKPQGGYEVGIEDAINNLRESRRDDIYFIDIPTTYQQYLENIYKSSIVLLLYNSQHYQNRFSGVLLEAFYLGRPVITSAGTWLAEQVELYGGGLVVNHSNPKDIIKAINTIKTNYQEYSTQAMSAGAILYEKNNGLALANLICEKFSEQYSS